MIDLAHYERKVHSQNGEDGVIEKIFEIIDTKLKYFVEFGVEDGSECNTRYLREVRGWNGLMMDQDYKNPELNLQKEKITAENINRLFRKHKVPYHFDLLSIDIDFNDFYIWKALSTRYRPRVVVIEYNATHLPHEDKVVPYVPDAFWDGTNYYGASILALYQLGKKKGYSLIYAENNAVNLIFLRDEEAGIMFKNINCIDRLYKPRNVHLYHPEDPFKREYLSAEKILRNESPG